MAWVSFKLFKDEQQEKQVSISLEWLTAIIEHDQKKTELLMGDESIIVHGSFQEVSNKINQAQV